MKKISMTSRPQGAGARSPDHWVADRSTAVVTKRLTIDVPEDLHRRMKVQCAVRDHRMADVVRELLEQHFPEDQAASGQAGAAGE